MKRGFWLIAMIVTGCVGAKFRDTGPLQTTMSQTADKISMNLSQAEHDYEQKNYLFKNLQARAKGETKDALNNDFKRMTAAIESLRSDNEGLQKARADYRELTDGKAQISSTDANWSASERALATFNDQIKAFNLALLNYSRESNSFANLVTDQKLYFMADISQALHRMGETVKRGKLQVKVFNADIKAAEKLAVQNGAAMSDTDKQTLSADQMAYADQLSELDKTLSTLRARWGAKKQISSADPGWSEFEKLMAEAEIHGKNMADIAKRLPVEIEAIKVRSSR